MSPLAHCAVFWFTGLLAGTLLGWVQGRRQTVKDGEQKGSSPQRSTSLRVVQETPAERRSVQKCS